MKICLLMVALAFAVVGCKRAEPRVESVTPVAVAPEQRITLHGRIPIAASAHLRGFSGLARGEGGVVWAVPERGRSVVSLRVSTDLDRIEIAEQLPLVGVPAGWDTESVAFLGDGRFVFGTETQKSRSRDELLLAVRGEGGITVNDRIPLNYDLWGIVGSVNHGIEGLCTDRGDLYVGIEMTLGGQGRFAPVGRYQQTTSQWTAFRVRLHTETGVISALTCRAAIDPNHVELFAIERHYGVSVLLRFTLPRTGGGAEVESEVIANLGESVTGIPNMEGLVMLSEHEIGIIVDNDTGGVSGPNEVVILRFGVVAAGNKIEPGDMGSRD